MIDDNLSQKPETEFLIFYFIFLTDIDADLPFKNWLLYLLLWVIQPNQKLPKSQHK